MTTKHTIIRWHGFGACMVCGKMKELQEERKSEL